MISKESIDEILKENDIRSALLKADYNAVTGKDAPLERVLLEIPDYAIKKQWVPKAMMKNMLVNEIVTAGSIKKFLKKHPEEDEHNIEVRLRRIRHKYDFINWAYWCFPILGKEGGEVRFRLNRAQIVVFEKCMELIDEGVPIDIIIVKARQWGGSTFSICFQAWIMFKLDNYHSFVVAAQVNGAAETILRMLKHAISKYPAWDLGLPEGETLKLAPAGKSGNAYVIKNSNDVQVIPATIYIGSVQNPDSIRSSAVSGAHYSEVGVWPNTEEHNPRSLIASISGAILKRPLTMQVMESTAKASDDFFHDEYIRAKEGRSSYHPIFIPWYYIPYDTIPIKDKRKFVRELLEHKDEDQPYGKWLTSGKHMWWLWTLGATLEGLNWYRYKRLDFPTYAQMANECPSNDIEAFQAAGSHVFDIYQVEELRKLCREPIKRGRLTSNDRRDKGVLRDIRFIEQTNGDLDIWEMPDDSEVSNRYLVSVDIGGPNHSSDYHAVKVFDRLLMMPDYGGKPAVVAQMHYHCDRDQLVYDVVRLAKWYNDALLVIESNTLETHDPNRDAGGDGSQYVLDVASELYPHLYTREADSDQIVEGSPRKWGFHTNVRTKPLLIDLARWAIKDKAWDEPDATTINEFAMYIEDHGKFTAPANKHDDLCMSTMIGLFVCYREMPLPAWVVHTSTTTRMTTQTIASF